MDVALLKKNRRFIGQLVIITTAILAVGTLLLYLPLAGKLADMEKVFQVETDEIARLQKEASLLTAKKEPRETAGMALGSTELIARVNEALQKNGIQVNRMRPGNKGDLSFSGQGEFFPLLRFLADLEGLAVTIERATLAPASGKGEPQQVTLEMTLQSEAAGSRPPPEQLAAMRELYVSQRGSDPFAVKRQTTRPVLQTGKGDNDLTWKYLLSGIGKLPDGEFVATIDRREFRVGDWLDEKMAVTGIQWDHVRLLAATETGEMEYRLGFRKQVGRAKKADGKNQGDEPGG